MNFCQKYIVSIYKEIVSMIDWTDILFFGTYNVLYAFYVELHPGLGKIILRTDSDGRNRLNMSSFFNFITSPLNWKKKNVMKMFWQPGNLDINYVFTTAMFLSAYSLLRTGGKMSAIL